MRGQTFLSCALVAALATPTCAAPLMKRDDALEARSPLVVDGKAFMKVGTLNIGQDFLQRRQELEEAAAEGAAG